MGFFTTIDRLKTINPDPDQAHVALIKAQGPPVEHPAGHETEPAVPLSADTGQQPAKGQQVKKQRKPERLSFLRPCPLCAGRAFIFGLHGGFFCSTCQPGIKGQPVEATGPDRKQDLQAVPDPAGSAETMYVPRAFAGRLGESPENFKEAWPWLNKNLSTLLSAGWTRATLFQRGKHRYPTGVWGAAWFDVWRKEILTISIGKDGALSFTFRTPGKIIEQTIYRHYTM